MRSPSLWLLLLLLLVILSGCAVSQEDREFYYRGWWQPTDLDKPTPYRHPPSAPPSGTE
ncbi:MAG: hypothetical protein JO295_10650 [Verrucomicrobia bacterium]|nr:hypothetical protein [Verrucomicrobiota bacterium]